MLELLLAVTLFLVFGSATVSLYTANLKRFGAEQYTGEMNQSVRNLMALITLEIQQAGSHPDVTTTTSAPITGSATPQAISVTETDNLNVGDWVTIDPGGLPEETVKITATGNGTITGKFVKNHNTNALVVLFAQPFTGGIVSSLGAGSSSTNNYLRFFGDINNDGTLDYVEYTYNSASKEVLRSITPISADSKSAATAIAENVSAISFTMYSDSLACVTQVRISITSNSYNKSQTNTITLSNTVTARSVAAASRLKALAKQPGGVNHLPPTPSHVVSWST
ncbi:MAG: hypothetical protein HY232_19155 [Acidobacteria bacterium]|nr:hypothetical protein [Acidobacteriota bacterium]